MRLGDREAPRPGGEELPDHLRPRRDAPARPATSRDLTGFEPLTTARAHDLRGRIRSTFLVVEQHRCVPEAELAAIED
jgi:hypothetical protein